MAGQPGEHHLIKILAAAGAALVLCGSGFAQSAHAQSNILFIFDASGSMKTAVGSDTRIGIAKKAMHKMLTDMPKDFHLGLMMYGHRRAADCTDLELVSPIGADDAAAIDKTIQAVQPKGETPIAVALRQAARSFSILKGQNNSIVLVTDGIEECKGDPCAAANEIKASGIGLKVDIVGFTLTDAQRKAIQCVPDATGGQYFEARDLPSLDKALGDIRQRTAQATPPAPQPAGPPPPAAPSPPPENNLLSTANGGQLISAPDVSWGGAITGNDKDMVRFSGCGGMPFDAIFAFKDERPATFAKFSMLVPGVGKWIKDFELLAADDSPSGSYRSLGTFTLQNMAMIKTPYQEFTFTETTAKYLKVRVLSAQGGDCDNRFTQIRLIGKLGDAPAPSSAATSQVNLLAPSQGGQLLAAPDSSWSALISGKDEDMARFSACGGTPAEAIYAFKDEKPATFDKFAVLIPSTGKWVKDIEVLAADDSPTGTYRSLGKFTVLNSRVLKTPYQEFSFPETTAKYVKYRVLSGQPGDCDNRLTQIRVMGKPSP
jgi:hypothetical protein